jgi:hypothetical protein
MPNFFFLVVLACFLPKVAHGELYDVHMYGDEDSLHYGETKTIELSVIGYYENLWDPNVNMKVEVVYWPANAPLILLDSQVVWVGSQGGPERKGKVRVRFTAASTELRSYDGEVRISSVDGKFGTGTGFTFKVVASPAGVGMRKSHFYDVFQQDDGSLRIDVSPDSLGSSVKIWDAAGRLIHSSKIDRTPLSIATNGWNKGAYFISGLSERKKVMIK